MHENIPLHYVYTEIKKDFWNKEIFKNKKSETKSRKGLDNSMLKFVK